MKDDNGYFKTLHWVEKNRRLSRGLRGFFNRNSKMSKRSFRTLRLGPQWADNLFPGQIIDISVSDNETFLNVIGKARVLSVSKIELQSIRSNHLKRNIGSKSVAKMIKDLKLVYGEPRVSPISTISIIDLVPTSISALLKM